MRPLHTVDNKRILNFQPVETTLINKMIGHEKTAIETYKELIESAETRTEQAQYENLLKRHMLAKDFWKKEIISRETIVDEIRSFRSSTYKFLVNIISKFNKSTTLALLKKFELMNLNNYKEIISNNSISHQLKIRVNRLFLQNQKRAINSINVYKAA